MLDNATCAIIRHLLLEIPLEFAQVLPQRRPGVLHARHATALQQGDHMLYKRAHIARPEPLPNGKTIAADRLHGACHAVGDALSRANEGQGTETDLADGDLAESRYPTRCVELGELAAQALRRPLLQPSWPLRPA